jgi:hypothetical protein
MIVQFVIQVDVRATRSIEASEQLADHDHKLHVRGLMDEPSLYLVLILLGRLASVQDVLGIGIEFAAFVALLRLL